MDLQALKKQIVCEELGITGEFGNTIAFVDFANVNNWFREDRQMSDGTPLKDNEKLGAKGSF